jgi:hypothetical protein
MKINYKITNVASVLLLCSAFLLASCGTSSLGRLDTPSGRPEVTIANSSIQPVMDGIAAWLASQGRTILETSAYTISASFTKPYSFIGINTKKFYSSVYTIVQDGTNVELYEKTESGLSELNEQSDYEDMQKELTQIAEFIKTRSSAVPTR